MTSARVVVRSFVCRVITTGHHHWSSPTYHRIGAPCPTARGLHNRTVIVRAGDALIIPPLHIHRVETLSASINYNVRHSHNVW
eukprot:COSAG05_NODE_7963_length_751_cov_1.340491_2_plen_82_part_01